MPRDTRYSIYLKFEKIFSFRRWILNRCRLRHNRDRRTTVPGKAWKLGETSGKEGGRGRRPREREWSYIFDTRYLLHSYSGSPFMEPYFTRNWAPTVHCVDHNGRIITATEHRPPPSLSLSVLPPPSISSSLFFSRPLSTFLTIFDPLFCFPSPLLWFLPFASMAMQPSASHVQSLYGL